MTVLSKQKKVLRNFFFQALTNKKSSIPIVATLLLGIYLSHYKSKKMRQRLIKSSQENFKFTNIFQKQKKRPNFNKKSIKNLFSLLKICFPKFFQILNLEIFVMILSLICRTFLSIQIAQVNGSLVQSIMSRNKQQFTQHILTMCVIAIPASLLNSFISFLKKNISFHVRENLTNYFQSRYIQNMRFYQVSNIDSRIKNPDQRITQDIERFANSFAELYSNVTKPCLDMILFTRSLAQKVGYKTVSLAFIWYGFSGLLLKYISPPMGMLTAFQQNYEGHYRAQQSNIRAYSQEIAFLNGGKWEKQQLDQRFDTLYKHNKDILNKRLFLGIFDCLMTKYGATLIGYLILSKPTMSFFDKSSVEKQSISEITSDYIRNGSLMVNLAKAIGRIVISYKDIQNISGYSSLLSEIQRVLDDLDQQKYQRGISDKGHMSKMQMKNRGKITITSKDVIQFKDVLVVTPNGNVLLESLNFILKRGENLIISGPNGCGKSSLFRVLGNLWPLIKGSIERPEIDHLFYLPQRPYISEGRLVDQIMYPSFDIEVDYQKVFKWMEFVKLGNLLAEGKEKESLLDVKDWKQVLSEGEKQRIAMARLLYHQPSFAILDECSSRVSADMESSFYLKAKEEGISLFTIAHRVSLFKFHDKCLRIEKGGMWKIVELSKEELMKIENNHEVSDESSVNQ